MSSDTPARILGLNTSARRHGNTELLIRHVLRGAAGEGAETRLLSAGELDLHPCTGCMSCVMRDRDCVLKDDLGQVLEALRWADAVVIGSPTYVLGVCAVARLLQERLLRLGMSRELVGRPAVVVATAGVPGWTPYVLPQLALLPLFAGMPVVDQFIGFGQGPGEVLDDTAACDRALAAGAALAQGETAYRGDPGACPECHFDLVAPSKPGRGHCPFCALDGQWVGDDAGGRLEPDQGSKSRWSEDAMHHHFHEVVLPSGPRFRSRLKDLKGRTQAFLDEDALE